MKVEKRKWVCQGFGLRHQGRHKIDMELNISQSLHGETSSRPTNTMEMIYFKSMALSPGLLSAPDSTLLAHPPTCPPSPQ